MLPSSEQWNTYKHLHFSKRDGLQEISKPLFSLSGAMALKFCGEIQLRIGDYVETQVLSLKFYMSTKTKYRAKV